MRVGGVSVKQISYETDRDKFIGRGNTTANPAAMHSMEALSGSKGSVIDPIVSIRYTILLDENERQG